MKRLGPLVTLKILCSDCEYERSEYYAVQSDTGFRTSCSAPTIVEANGKPRGTDGYYAPTWCPLRASAIAKLVEENRR